MQNILFISFLITVFIANSIFKKKNFFSNYSGEIHQTLTGKSNVPLSGGIFILLFMLTLFLENYSNFAFFLIAIFLLGFLSDIKILVSPKIRFLIQIILLINFVYFAELHISSTRIILFDELLKNSIVSLLFTSFCLIILINGTNFIDGLNGLVLGYYLSIVLILLNLGLLENLALNYHLIIYLIVFLTFLLLLNIFNQLYLGDSGSYLLSFIAGVILIKIYNENQNISPFFIVLLLWYPAFENLFSILRKFKLKLSPVLPDRQHLHQLIFIFIKKKTSYKKITNSLSGFIIVFYNAVILFVASLDIYNTQYQIFLIIFNLVLYILIYSKILLFLKLSSKI
jgi:UDP-N-acetylmuramyl pentapeptide phosphotransferase/UDP-N-acetylglucosamine-1-phosphate transferase